MQVLSFTRQLEKLHESRRSVNPGSYDLGMTMSVMAVLLDWSLIKVVAQGVVETLADAAFSGAIATKLSRMRHQNYFLTHNSTLVAFTGVNNAQGHSPQKTACSLMTATGSNLA